MGRRLPSRRKGIAPRALALSMALVALVSILPAVSAPGDLFSVAAPAVTDTPKGAAAIGSGDASVATQTGALTFSFPITVAPGRHGVQPNLALSYSSQAAIYGTVTSGWALGGIPIVYESTSQGRLVTASTGTKLYASSMAGGRPLVPVFEGGATRFRAANDASFTRYTKTQPGGPGAFSWRAESPDG